MLSATVGVAPWFIFVAAVKRPGLSAGDSRLDAAADRSRRPRVRARLRHRQPARRARAVETTRGPAGRFVSHLARGRRHDPVDAQHDAGVHPDAGDPRHRTHRRRADDPLRPEVVAVSRDDRNRRPGSRTVDPGIREVDGRRREAYEDLWLATICGIPLVILVVGIGEPPRHYLAQMAIGAGIVRVAGFGCSMWPIRRSPALTFLAMGAIVGSVVGLMVGFALLDRGWRERDRRPRRWPGCRRRDRAAPLDLRLDSSAAPGRGRTEHAVAGSRWPDGREPGRCLGVLAFTIGLRPPTTAGKRPWIVVAWVRDNRAPGATIAFGSYLGYEMALPLRAITRCAWSDTSRRRRMSPPPTAWRCSASQRPTTGCRSMPRHTTSTSSWRSRRGTFLGQLRRSGADYCAYSTGTTTSAPRSSRHSRGRPGSSGSRTGRSRGRAAVRSSTYRLPPRSRSTGARYRPDPDRARRDRADGGADRARRGDRARATAGGPGRGRSTDRGRRTRLIARLRALAQT